MNRSNPSRKRTALWAGIILTLTLAALLAWASFRPPALESVKTITVAVTHSDGRQTAREIKTTSRILSEALVLEGLLEYQPGDQGRILYTMDGEIADSDAGLGWYCIANSSDILTDLSDWPLEDGDVFSFYTYAADDQ